MGTTNALCGMLCARTRPDVDAGTRPAYQDSYREETIVKIALISEHASPLAATGSVDSGGQNV
jgi:hypothetical protein